jgi:Ca-activated chloride channel family protein
MESWLFPRFVRPEAWWLALVIPVLWLVWWFARRQRRATIRQWLGAQAGLFLPPHRWVGRWLIVLILLGLITALAGPEMGTTSLTPTNSARDLILFVDVSQSMLAEDRPPQSRLQRTKEAILQLFHHLEQRSSTARVGIAIFAGRARLICPPTEDREHLTKVVREMSPNSFGPLGRLVETEPTPAGTSFRRAVQLAQDWMAEIGNDSFFTDILVLTDGDDVAGDAESAGQAAAEARLEINVLGVGNPSQDTPIPHGSGFLMTTDPATGQPRRVVTRRHDQHLAQLAGPSKGMLILEEQYDRPLVSWWQEHLAARPTRPLHSAARLVPVIRSDWMLAGVLVVMMLEGAFGGARRREW